MTFLLRSLVVNRLSLNGLSRVNTGNRVLRITAYVIVIYVALTSLVALSAQRAANDLFDTDVASTLAGGEVELDLLEGKLGIFDYRFQRLERWLIPIRQFSKLAIVISPLDRQRQAGELLLDRVDQNIVVAESAINMGRSTYIIRGATSSGVDPDAGAAVLDDLRSSLEQLKHDSQHLLLDIGVAESSGEKFESLAVGGPVGALHSRVSDQEVQLRNLAQFSVLLSEVVLADLDLLSEMSSSFEKLDGFIDGESSIQKVSTLINELVIETKRARDISTEMIEQMPAVISQSDYSETVRSIHALNVSAHDLISGVGTIVDAGAEMIDILASGQGSLFDDGQTISAAVSSLIEQEQDLKTAVRAVTDSVDELVEIGQDGAISLGKFGDVLESNVEPLLEISVMFEGAPRVAADVFGIDGSTRRYLLLGQTADELRASGGFTSSIWLLTFERGALVSNDYVEIDNVDDRGSLDKFPEAHGELQLHMDAGVMYLRDVGWDPHFPSVGALTAELYGIDREAQIDGVISLSQWAFVDLVSILGGIESESGFVSSSDILGIIEDGTDTEGTGFLEPLFGALLESLSGENVRSRGVSLISTMQNLAESKDLMFYSTNTETQAAISAIGWAGEVPISQHDRLIVVDSNVGWNKVDRQIDRQFVYEVDLTEISAPTARLSMEYRNNSDLEIAVASDCESQSHVRRIDYKRRLHGCYWDYLRIYVPLGARLDGGDKFPLPAGSIASLVSGFSAGSQSLDQKFDDNGTYFSGLMTIESQTSKNVEFLYTLPSSVVTSQEGVFEYSLDVVVQSGTRGRPGTVEITVPDGYEVISYSPIGSRRANQVIIEVDPTRDVTIEIQFAKIATSPN
jgi:hypothetical protein